MDRRTDMKESEHKGCRSRCEICWQNKNCQSLQFSFLPQKPEQAKQKPNWFFGCQSEKRKIKVLIALDERLIFSVRVRKTTNKPFLKGQNLNLDYVP